MERTQQNFGPAGYLCRVAMPIFKIFLSRQIQRTFLIFLFFAKHKNAYILKTVLDRADCADFGCHNSIRLETKHFLNTLALTFISFSGRFVFAMQKHYLFFLRAILQFSLYMPSLDLYFPKFGLQEITNPGGIFCVPLYLWL